MKRTAFESLKNWKKSQNRKPMILWGARQVGKTWLLKEFGRAEYKQTVYLNFDDNPQLCAYFRQNLDTARVIGALETHFNLKITPADTLIIFDELQECQRAKDSLKYFNENAPQYHIAAAGSLLGVSGGKFPVGQVDSLTLYPMSFYEFLKAAEREQLLEAINKQDIHLLESLSGLLTDMLKTYLYVGGMPAVVDIFLKTKDLAKVRAIQNEILADYKNDFSKHINPNDIAKVRMLWDSIPVHLAREKKKFIYKEVKTGGRAAEFENAMDWLINTGLVYKVPRTLTPKLPLSRDQEREAFKIFMLDVGLLCAKTNIDLSSFYIAEPKIFEDFHGALSEQYVCQELKTTVSTPLFYWGRDKSSAEIDFIMQYKSEIIPIEVKANKNTQAKSLKVYIKEYNPKTAIRTSLKNFGFDGVLYSIPLYMIESLEDILKD
ncbi:MAG: ATP-binding protein [Endomicrobium sp.]|jgi:predicted AAA+ superfamily ATPase|nr:ATP-binding protein [Endomicrobium sp.]